MEPNIIYQDDQLLVLDKPPSWVVNDAQTTKHLLTVQSWLKKNFIYVISGNNELRSGIVHRLDKDTSGVLLVAKTQLAFKVLQSQFKDRDVKKTYFALVHGHPVQTKGEISATVGRLPWNRRKFGVLPGGREAITGYQIISKYNLSDLDEKLAFLKLFPKTGRTHQIRIHLKYLGHPIVADKTYVGRKTWRHDTKWCPRIFLHAHEIIISHPKTQRKMSFASPLARDLFEVLKKLKKE